MNVRKSIMYLPMSAELLGGEEDEVPSTPPRFSWPDFRCGYEYSNDYYSEGHTCDLPLNHIEFGIPHRCTLEWETKPADLCKALGHEWGEWAPLPPQPPLTLTFPFCKKKPTKSRTCKRCGGPDDDGEYDWSIIYPPVAAFLSKLPRARLTEWDVEPR